jgi:hypothetical protein
VSSNIHDVLGIANILIRVSAALRALHIIPRESTSLPLEERPEDDLNAEQLRQVVRTLKLSCATMMIAQNR